MDAKLSSDSQGILLRPEKTNRKQCRPRAHRNCCAVCGRGGAVYNDRVTMCKSERWANQGHGLCSLNRDNCFYLLNVLALV